MKNRILLIPVLVCVLAHTPCSNYHGWTDYLGNPQRTGYSPYGGPEMPEVLWKVKVSGNHGNPTFIMDNKVLIYYETSEEGFNPGMTVCSPRMILLDLLTGEVLQDVSTYSFEVFPVDGKIIGLSGRTLHEIDIASGETTLLAEIPEKTFDTSTRSSQLSKEKSGNNLPSKVTGKPFYYIPPICPIILEEKLIFPTIPAVCLSKSTFKILWNLEDTMPDPSLEPYDIAGDEEIAVFIMKKEGYFHLLAVNSPTGAFKWMSNRLPLGRWLTLGEDIYCGGLKLWAFRRDGRELWEFEPEKEVVTNIVLGPDGLYCADAAKNLYKIDLNGNLVWKTEWEGSPYFHSHLIGGGHLLYCVENLGDNPAEDPTGSQVTAYNMEDGSKLWSLYLGDTSWVTDSPAIVEGILVVGTKNGEITAIASDPELFVKQGDAFLEKGESEKAVSSQEKAAELHEKMKSQPQEIQKTLQPRTPSLPTRERFDLRLLVAITVVVIGIIIYYCAKCR